MSNELPRRGSGAVPIPNRLFDELMPRLSDSELRVLLLVLRQTIGWRERTEDGWRHKRRDWISQAQMMKRTGRGSEAVSKAVGSLVGLGLIVAEAADGRALDTAAKRRAYVGRMYFRPGDMWITPARLQLGKPNKTTYNVYNIGGRKIGGWTRASAIERGH